MNVAVAAGYNNPNKGKEVAQAVLARCRALSVMCASWSDPAMSAVTAASVAGRTSADFKIVNKNFSQIVALDMAQNGVITDISSQRPCDLGVAEATVGALALIGEPTPPYVVVPPLTVTRDVMPDACKMICRIDLPGEMVTALAQQRQLRARHIPCRARISVYGLPCPTSLLCLASRKVLLTCRC